MQQKYDGLNTNFRANSLFSLVLSLRKGEKIEEESKNIKTEEKIEKNNIEKEPPNGTLRNFKRGELSRLVDKFIVENKLEKHETVPSSKIALFSRQLRKNGYNATETSIAAVLRKKDYSYPVK